MTIKLLIFVYFLMVGRLPNMDSPASWLPAACGTFHGLRALQGLTSFFFICGATFVGVGGCSHFVLRKGATVSKCSCHTENHQRQPIRWSSGGSLSQVAVWKRLVSLHLGLTCSCIVGICWHLLKDLKVVESLWLDDPSPSEKNTCTKLRNMSVWYVWVIATGQPFG